MNDYQPIAPHAKQQANALLTVLVNHPLPVDVQITLGTAACFLREVERVLPDRPGAKQKRRVSA
ncbi:MAG: hypothetical protein H6958_10420 [Chromatiaceae bacterium]|nr:hypothetical protein [Chromatiaceae bacterium]